MTQKIKVIEGKNVATIGIVREMYRNNTFGGIYTREMSISRESTNQINKFISSIEPLVTIYNRIVNKSTLPLPPYEIIQQMHLELIDLAAKKGYDLNAEVDTAMYNRILPAVKGFIVQDNVLPLFLEISDDIIVLKNDYLDANGKADFIVAKLSTQMAYFIDVTTAKQWEQKTKFRQSDHCYLLYDNDEDCEESFLSNEFAFLKRRYISKSMNDWVEDKSKGVRIDSLIFKKEFLKHKGEWKLFKCNNLHKDYENEVKELIAFLEQ